MSQRSQLSRREFVGAALSAATVSSVPIPNFFCSSRGDNPSAADPTWKDEGVLFVDKSPYAKLHNIPVHAVTITQGFWGARRETNVDKSIPSMEKLLEANGRMNNFLRLAGKSDAAQHGPVYSDSDVYKWTEAAGFALQSGDRPELRATADKIIKEIVAVQERSGYLNTYYVGDHAKDRMAPQVQRWGHELYNIGHMVQGAIAYYRATGDGTLLDAGIRFVDGYLLPNFGPGPNKKPILSGHPEIELALIELYRTTGDKRYLELAGYILHGDDRIKLPQDGYVYHFSGIPFTSRTHLEGHAVRAMYACCGATDYYLETGDQSYWKTLNVLWEDLVSSQMYVTGGVGARSEGEAFGDSYELPNFTAYGESCAAIGNMMWNWRMLAATGDANPWDGTVEISVAPAKPSEFTFYLRVPGWSYGTQISINGKPLSGATPGQYLALQRRWSSGDVINVKFGMTPQVIEANSRVVDDYGRVAVQRGPLVYCLEQLDQPDGVQLFDVSLDVRQEASSKFREEFHNDLLGGIVVLKHTGAVSANSNSLRSLYRPYTAEAPKARQVELRFVPYYAWANRAATPMQVWTPILRA